jgi:hypothetical protein
MAVLFKGSGLVWIPSKHRSVRFVGGEYLAHDADEIAVLSAQFQAVPSGEVAPEPEVEKPKRGRPRNV